MRLIVQRIKMVDVSIEVLSIAWRLPVSRESAHLTCSACHKPLGLNRWAVGWVSEAGQERSMRLCETCAMAVEGT